jgi:membrane associated rhomboid family serine protease
MLEDRNYMRQPPFATRRSATLTLLIANAVAFVLECFLYGFPPHFPPNDLLALSWNGLRHGFVWQLLTFQFLHGGLWHLFFNCWAIFVFGRPVEEALGAKRFWILYLTSGVMGGLTQALAGGLAEHFGASRWALHFLAPTVGASAGAFGLLAAYATLFPERPLTLLLFFVLPVSMRAKFLLLFSGLLALFGILFPIDNMADAAHLGGLLTGIAFIRYVSHWSWSFRWPRWGRKPRRASREFVPVSSTASGIWNKSRASAASDLPAEEFLSKEVDPILDKISAHGIQSLTENERRILEAARQKMGRR